MATYWINSPVSWAADSPIHAGITRKALQDNALAVYENSGFSVNFGLLSGSSYFGAAMIDTSWEWLEDWKPLPVPVAQIQGGGWRDYTVEVWGAVGGGTCYLRAWLLATRAQPALDATTGAIADSTAYGQITLNSTAQRKGATVELEDIGSIVVDGLVIPVCWLHFSAKCSVLASFIMRNMRITEAA